MWNVIAMQRKAVSTSLPGDSYARPSWRAAVPDDL